MFKTPSKGFIAVCLAALCGGGIAVMGKIGLQVIPPTTFTFFRFIIAAMCVYPSIRPIPKLTRLQLLQIIFVSLLATGNVTFFAYGVRNTTATISQLLYAVVPVLSLILVRILYKERITPTKFFGVGLGFIGVFILIVLPVIAKGSIFSGTIYGNVTVLLAVVCFSLYSVLSKTFQSYVSPQFLTFVFAITTCIVLSPFVILEYQAHPTWISQLTIAPILSTVYVGVVGGALYYFFY